jgi:hypothetical protein
MTAPCTFLLGALLAVVASAQWPRLPRIDPGHIAGVVESAEKEVKQTLSEKQNQALASEVAKKAKDLRSQAPSVADNVAQNAAQAVSASVQTAEAAKSIAGDAQAQQQVLTSEVSNEVKDLHGQAPFVAGNVAQSAAQAVSAAAQRADAAKTIARDAQAQQVGVIGGPPALATAVPAQAPVVSEGSHDALHMDKLLETVQGQINRSKVNEGLGSTPESLSEAVEIALDSKNIKKAADGVQEAHNIAQANKKYVEDLASKGHDLASEMIPGLNPYKVTGGVSKVVDGASKHIEAVKPMIHKVLKSDTKNAAQAVEKVVKYIGKIDPNSARKYINGDEPEEDQQALYVEEAAKEAAEWVGSHWQWSLLFIVGAVGALFFGWQVTKPRDSRTPKLLTDSDMVGWNGRGPPHNNSCQMQSEEVLFRQL